MSESGINAAVADFIAEIVVKHGTEPKKIYCDKDPFNLRNCLMKWYYNTYYKIIKLYHNRSAKTKN